MAFKLGELFVQITGQDGGLRSTIASASRGLLGLLGQANALGSLGVFGAAGSLTLALGVSAKAAIDLETKFVSLSKAIDLDPAGMKALENQLKKLAVTLNGVSYEDLIDIATTGAKMGVAAEDLARYAEGIAKVSTAMDDIPAEQIADQIGKINSVFKLGVDGALQLGSAIDKLADSGTSSASGILSVTQRLSGVAAVAKISASDTTALAAALLDTGTQAELASSVLARLVLSLNDVDSRKTFGKVLGIGAAEFAAKVKQGPMEAIEEFLDKLKDLDAGSQAKALEGIGFEGVQGIAEIQKLAQQVDKIRLYAKQAASEFKTLDQVNKSYAASSATLAARIANVKNQLLILAQKVGDALMPPIRVGLDLISGLTSGLGSAFDTLVLGASRVAERVARLPEQITLAFGPGPVGLVSGLAGAIGGTLFDVLDRVGLVIRNFPDLFDIMVLQGSQAFVNLGEVVATLPANLAIVANYIRDNWSKLILDGINLVSTGFRNLLTNVGDMMTAIQGYLNGEGFKFQWTDLGKDFKAEADKLPALVAPEFTSFQDQIDAKIAEIGQREAMAGQAAIAAKPNAPADNAKPGDAKAGDFAKTKKDRGEIGDLASFAASLQKAVSGKDKAAADTAKGVAQTVDQLKLLNKALTGKSSINPAVAVGAGWQAAGLA